MKYIAVVFFSVIMASMFAQSPMSIPFQAIAKVNGAYVLVNENIAVDFKIRSGATNGPIKFHETHNILTNSVGGFSANIGEGQLIEGDFSSFANKDITCFLEVTLTDSNGSYSLGTKQLNAVPHAKYANAERFRISATGDTLFKGINQGIIIPGISVAN